MLIITGTAGGLNTISEAGNGSLTRRRTRDMGRCIYPERISPWIGYDPAKVVVTLPQKVRFRRGIRGVNDCALSRHFERSGASR